MGTVVKPHGLHGELVVSLVSNRLERLRPGATLGVAGGELVVVSARPLGPRWLVRFEGVGSRDAAERLRGEVLRASPIEDEDAWWVHELVGAEVVDTAGARLGTVRAVVANAASDLLELDGGELIPLCFATGRHRGQVTVDLPPGLLDPPPA